MAGVRFELAVVQEKVRGGKIFLENVLSLTKAWDTCWGGVCGCEIASALGSLQWLG